MPGTSDPNSPHHAAQKARRRLLRVPFHTKGLSVTSPTIDKTPEKSPPPAREHAENREKSHGPSHARNNIHAFSKYQCQCQCLFSVRECHFFVSSSRYWFGTARLSAGSVSALSAFSPPQPALVRYCQVFSRLWFGTVRSCQACEGG